MDATEILTNEHRLIEQVLNCLEKLVGQCVADNKLPGAPAKDAIVFFRDYTDRYHYEKEERHLFPALEAAGFPRNVGPTGVMLQEHEQARAHVRAMDSAVTSCRHGARRADDADAAKRFIDHAGAYIRLLREHIQKEDQCLFPLVHQALAFAEQDRLAAEFERIASGQNARQTAQRCLHIANELADHLDVPRVPESSEHPHSCHCWLYSRLAEQSAIIRRHNLVVSQQLEMARQVQLALVPRSIANMQGLEMAWKYEPAMQVGGDVLDVIKLGDDRVLFFVGDAMGHGVQAALVMCAAKTALRLAVAEDPRPQRVLTRINRTLADMFSEHFVTAACCVVDTSGGEPLEGCRAEIARAGHAGPLGSRPELADALHQGAAGLPLGVAVDTHYEATSVTLGPGDSLLFYTDGIIEATDRADRQYGTRRLARQLAVGGELPPGELLARIRSDLTNHCQAPTIEDDLTLLLVKTVQVPAAGAMAAAPAGLAEVAANGHAEFEQ